MSVCNNVVFPRNVFKAVAWSLCCYPGDKTYKVVHPKPLCPRWVSVAESLGWYSCLLQVCVNLPVSELDTGVLEKLLTKGHLEFLSSCCFCDLVWFLVSQKALFLGFVAAFSLAL